MYICIYIFFNRCMCKPWLLRPGPGIEPRWPKPGSRPQPTFKSLGF